MMEKKLTSNKLKRLKIYNYCHAPLSIDSMEMHTASNLELDHLQQMQ